MKTTTKKTCFKGIFAIALAAMALFNTHQAWATELIGWTAGVPELTGYGPSPWAPTTGNPNLTVVGLTRGSGLLTTGTAASFAWGADGWSTNTEASGITSNQYVTCSITPNPGYTLSITNIPVWNYRRLTNGPSSGTLAFSLNGGAYTEIITNSWSNTSSTGGDVGPISITNAGLQNIPPGTLVTFRIVNYGSFNSAGTWYIYDPTTGPNDFEFDGTLVSSGVAPTNLVVTPSGSITTNAGANVTYTVVYGGDPATNYWYLVSGGTTNLVSSNTINALTLSGVTATNDGQYYVVLSNATGSATSSSVTLSVTDPYILSEPNSTYGLLGNQAQFQVTAFGSSLSYQWYYASPSSNILGPVPNGVNSYSTSSNSGATTATLTVSGLTTNDLTNYIVVVSNTVNSLALTSSVASLLGVSNTAILAFWDFNGLVFSNNPTVPAPFLGVGSGSGANLPSTSPFYATTLDGTDGTGTLFPYGQDGPPFGALGTGDPGYPLPGTGSNQTVGVQFLTSTVGAQNITITYDSRATGTASDYERLQYTPDGGMTWSNFPTTTTFGAPTTLDTVATTAGQGNSGYATSSYFSFGPYNLSGFPGVDNNPLFGIRIVTEWESTGTYGASPNTNFYGVANTYGGATGTLTYDILKISGTAITNTNAAPFFGALTNAAVLDNSNITVNVPVFDTANPASTLTLSATSLGNIGPFGAQSAIGLSSGNFSFSGSGAGLTMTITPIQGRTGISPIAVTAVDPATGKSGTAWFDLTVTSLNPPPTNSLVGYPGTNMLANSTLALPFTATPVHASDSNLMSYSAVSSNNTVIPSGNITFTVTTNNEHPTAMIAAATNQLGAVPVSISADDNDPTEAETTTASFVVQVRPNTNVVLIDYFNYDAGLSSPVSLFDVSGLWTHLSGNAGQMTLGADGMIGYVKLDSLNNTENLHASLIGGPYATNTAAIVYASFIMNMSQTSMPLVNGSFFACFQDGTIVASNSSATADVSCRIIAATNNVATNGNYRLFISNAGTDATAGQMYPMDLIPGSNYIVVAKVVASNSFSTLWVNPNGTNSLSVSDTTGVATHYNIGAFELRESGTNAGAVYLTKLKVGTTFSSVLPSLQISVVGTNAIVTSSDPTLGIQSATSATGSFTNTSASTPYTNGIIPNGATYYQFGQTNVPIQPN